MSDLDDGSGSEGGGMAGLASDDGGSVAAASPRRDVSSSPEIYCIGCSISSKSLDPVEEKRSKRKRDSSAASTSGAAPTTASSRVQWGKTTTRKVRLRECPERRAKVRRTSGLWCRLCLNIARKMVKTEKFKKFSTKEAFKKLKKELQKDSALKTI